MDDGEVRALPAAELFDGRTVIVFALPGAFTPTCSSQHLPRFEELAPQFRAHGVDDIVCLSVNDPFVMAEWGKNQNLREVRLVSDGNGEFARGMGMLLDHRDLGMGERSRRYSMLVRDGRIEKMFVEPDRPGDPFEISDADTLFRHLAPDAPQPPHIALITKAGCPHCARARELLGQRGLAYTELPLTDAVRARVLAAVAGEQTAPQVFVDGRRIGGVEALERYLSGAAQPERASAATGG